MAQIIKIILITIITCISIYGQTSPFPEFIPYKADSLVEEIKADINIHEFGLEQSARWLSPDPLADKYPGWSPYNYCLNNPVNLVDPDGRDVIILLASRGASDKGHAAVLIGSEEKGWWYISKDGTQDGYGNFFGPSKNTVLHFSSFQKFEDKINKKLKNPYDFAYRIASDNNKDIKMIEVGKKEVMEYYNLSGNIIFAGNCMDLVDEVLKAGGFRSSSLTKLVKDTMTGQYNPELAPNPKDRYKSVRKKNEGYDFLYNAKDKSENGDRFNNEN